MKNKIDDNEGSAALHCYASPASVGDVICCKVQNPFPQTLRVKLSTPEACAYGNKLIASGRWKKEVKSR